MIEREIVGFEGKKLYGYLWNDCKEPRGVVMIIHGMQEHATRYDEFAKFLNLHNYIAFASDLRGHGKTCGSVENQGHTDTDLFCEVVEDQKIIANYLMNEFGLPLVVLGHSFGSFVTQRFIQVCSLPTKAVIVGSAYTNTLEMRMAKALSAFLAKKNGLHSSGEVIENMSFKKYGKRFDNGNWLTRDTEKFDEYVLDQYCGKSFPIGFYKFMFANIVNNYKEIRRVSSSMPILLVAGDCDPVGKNGKLVKKLYMVYKKADKNVQLKLYRGGRHEILNETNRKQVFEDILEFIEE